MRARLLANVSLFLLNWFVLHMLIKFQFHALQTRAKTISTIFFYRPILRLMTLK